MSVSMGNIRSQEDIIVINEKTNPPKNGKIARVVRRELILSAVGPKEGANMLILTKQDLPRAKL